MISLDDRVSLSVLEKQARVIRILKGHGRSGIVKDDGYVSSSLILSERFPFISFIMLPGVKAKVKGSTAEVEGKFRLPLGGFHLRGLRFEDMFKRGLR